MQNILTSAVCINCQNEKKTPFRNGFQNCLVLVPSFYSEDWSA